MILTKAAFAVRMGVDRAQPTRWAARGMPTLPDGRVDADAAEAWVARTIDGTQRRRRSNGSRAGLGGSAAPPPPLDCMAHLEDRADLAAVLLTMTMAYATPANAAIMAVGAGASVAVARELASAMTIATMHEAEALLDAAGVPPPPGFDAWDGADVWDRTRFAAVNWPLLEQRAAERAPGATADWALRREVPAGPDAPRARGKMARC